MSMDSKILTAVKTVVSECKPNIYEGTSKEYAVYTYSQFPVIHADGRPDAIRYSIFVHLYLPKGVNPNAKKKLLANALLNAGFTYPSIVNASDSNGQHYSFECQAVDGDV